MIVVIDDKNEKERREHSSNPTKKKKMSCTRAKFYLNKDIIKFDKKNMTHRIIMIQSKNKKSNNNELISKVILTTNLLYIWDCFCNA